MPTPKKKTPAKPSAILDLEPALDEIEEEVDLDPNALVEDEDEKEAAAVEAISAEEEEGEDPLVLAKKDEDEDDVKPVVEEVSDGLEDEDGIKALNRAEKELHEMEFGSGGDAEEPEEEMI